MSLSTTLNFSILVQSSKYKHRVLLTVDREGGRVIISAGAPAAPPPPPPVFYGICEVLAHKSPPVSASLVLGLQ